MTNQSGETCYAYWKIIYEGISENFVRDNYKLEIASIKTKSNSVYQRKASENLQEEAKHNFAKGKKINSFTYKRKKLSLVVHDTPLIQKKEKEENVFYVPLAFYIQTKYPCSEPAELLLESLVRLMYSSPSFYKTETNNSIFKYGNVLLYILFLTHLVLPPPMSQLSICFPENEVVFAEGKLTELPYENDTSVSQLFCLLNSDIVILIWTALLLDARTIILVDDPNIIFHIIKGIQQLLFPFCWVFSAGITLSIKPLTNITPYFYGNL